MRSIKKVDIMNNDIDFTRTLDAIKEDLGQLTSHETVNGEGRKRESEPGDEVESEEEEEPRPRRKKGLMVAAIIVGVLFVDLDPQETPPEIGPIQ